jgi:hypothetical protein
MMVNSRVSPVTLFVVLMQLRLMLLFGSAVVGRYKTQEGLVTLDFDDEVLEHPGQVPVLAFGAAHLV